MTKNTTLRVITLVVAVAIVIAIYPSVAGHFNLRALAEREEEIRAGQTAQPLLFLAVAFLAYTLAVAIGIPGSSALSVVIGWLFGFWVGLPLVSFAATLGALITFLVARYCLRGLIERRFAGPLKKFEARFGGDCPSCLFSLRLIPGVPNLITNILPSFTAMRASTFWWVSQLGMLPGTITFVYIGSNLPNLIVIVEKGASSLISPGLVVGFVALGLTPLIIRIVSGRFGKGPVTEKV